MARPRMRPRYILDVETGADTIMSSLRGRLKASEPGLVGVFSERHGVVRLSPDRRRFWSPQLDILIEPHVEGIDHSRVVVRFAPHPPVWLAFVFTYAVLFALGVSGVMYAMAELSMGRAPWCLISTGFAIGVAAFVYGAAFIGQGLGADDMFELRTWLDQCLAEARERSRRVPVSPRDSAQL
jgi:hypothetical protein